MNQPGKTDAAAPLRTSALHNALLKLAPQWITVNHMQAALSIGTPVEERQKLQTIALADLSYFKRCGLKGPGAEAWLKSMGIAPPAAINQWAPVGKFGLIARLATSEFLLEDGRGQDYSDRVRAQLGRGVAGVTPVLRQDAEIALAGPLLNEVMLQTCSFNFTALDLSARPIVMTSMIGVSVLVIASTREGVPFYQIWCDATYAVYLWEQLREVAEQLGGGAVGLAAISPDIRSEYLF